ncbi:hypothetical protein XENTR_v10014722 [Xenopus tropicalis]|uniref:Serine/threonine kinase 25 n=1 Tax=Xenopus tropicalis TaxID=8364 RepID=Q0V9A7_XENTR|eukprot:NP_001072821.1 THAP domain-containing protein 4 [Xenopus tropicalis]
MVICCAAPSCTNRQGKGKKGDVSFHRFPLKDHVRLSLWTDALQRDNWTPGPYSFLCSDHFSPESFVRRMPDQTPLLTSNAVPSLFKNSCGRRKRGTVLRVSGVRRKKKAPKIRPVLIQGNNSVELPSGNICAESQNSIIITDDFKDAGCFLTHDVSPNSSSACKFISCLHSYSSSAKPPLSQNGTKVNLFSQIMDVIKPSHTPTSEVLPYATSGVTPSDDKDSDNSHLCRVEFSNDKGSQIIHTVTAQHPVSMEDTHCENKESSTVETEDPSSQSDMQICPIQPENYSALYQDIHSLHSYCFQSKPLSGRRNHLKKKGRNMKDRGDHYCCTQSFLELQSSPPLNPVVSQLAWMLGTWVSEPAGEGQFPTIPPFRYMEEATITHVGQPMLNFMFCASNAETGKPMHRECGFIRIKPGTNHVAFISAQNTGVVEVEEGEVEGEQLSLTSNSVSRISFAKEPHVTQISRKFRLTPEGKLEQTVFMATASQSLAPHLHVTYRKVTS